MEFTKKERVLLINQYRILAGLNKDDEEHYSELIAILENGYEIFYSMVDEWISDDMPEEEGRFVLDILDFYRIVEDTKRSSKDSRLIEHPFSIFRGFDGNNESEYMSFARFLINQQGKFSEQQDYLRKNDNLNSHMPLVKTYKAMLREWEKMDKRTSLSVDEVISVLDARRSAG